MNALTPKLRTTLVLTLLVALASQVSWAQSTPPVHSAPVMIAADTERPAKDAADAPGPVAPIVAPLPGLPGAQGGEAGATRPVIPAMAATRPGITLGPGDVIYVNVADEPTVTGSYTIREDGKVIFPEVGEIMVQGLTVTAVADAIAEKLKKFMVNPVVAVNAVSMLPRVVTVIGQIGRPGAYDMRQFPSLLALLVSVGGFDPGVDLGQAMLLRNGDVTRLSLQQGTGALSVPKDMALQPGDTIIIPSTGLADFKQLLDEMVKASDGIPPKQPAPEPQG